MTTMTPEDAIKAASSVAREIADGKLDPAALEAEMLTELRDLFAVVVEEHDPLWPLQVDVARQVVSRGGIPTDEMAEWLAVQRRRENPDAEPLNAPVADTSPEPVSSDSVEHSPENGAADDDFADVPREVIVQAERAALAVIDQWRESQR